MNSIYLQLILLVLIFASFGFLLHAFYFGDARQKQVVKELNRFKAELEEKERELRQAEESAQKSDRIIQSLEKQLHQKAAELEHLKQLAARQDKAIEMLQKDAEAIRAAVSGAARSARSLDDALAAVAPPQERQATPVLAPARRPEPEQSPGPETPPVAPLPGRQDAPAWKENLDNILSMLDTMEKEVDK